MKGDQFNGTLGGTVLSVAVILDPDHIFRTIVLAAIGAVVSFLVSSLMKVIFEKLRTWHSQKKD